MTRPHTTGVVGAGLMGRDIAGLLANGGFPVTLVDVDADALASARDYHQTILPEALDAAGLDPTEGLADRIDYDTDLDALADCEFVVEAVPERLELKRDLVADLEAVLPDDAVVGTNTSSLTPGDVAAELERPERVVLFHFANPALERDVVEISGDDAAERALSMARAVGEAIDRTPIELGAEYRANCLSRLSASIKCAGTWELLAADAAAIDRGAANVGFDRGPIEFIDLIGIDVHLATVANLGEVYGDRYAPPPLIHDRMDAMVAAGDLGKKTGQGFFEWDGETCLLPAVDEPHDVTPVVGALVNEGHRLVQDGVGDEDTIDEILKRGSGGDVGPFDVESMLGRDFLRETLQTRYEETGAAVYDPVF
ncbi:3-hydroxyacyl-CoA dehydrogenase NAD-binding domain-containing protein [Halorientalis brevis]|uniref:3-hydroxyacyl-CoA dehydrogenase NAD-binding domain-containing protein n=1 Tax=Halorientalis brevis TaxID=1126241 RepID=A0ABD6C861_9EURY|nr:3-hydroxyacyl-CoA dehydrogenase [Halorientalis brevis]